MINQELVNKVHKLNIKDLFELQKRINDLIFWELIGRRVIK